MNRLCTRNGQALAELTIALTVFVLLILCATQFAFILAKQTRARQEARRDAGILAFRSKANGFSGDTPVDNVAISPTSRANALTRLEDFVLPFSSTLPASHYTLNQRSAPLEELNLQSATISEQIPLDEAFSEALYPKGSLRIQESVTFPSLGGLCSPTP